MLSQKVHFIPQPCLILLSFNFLKIFLTQTFILKYSSRFFNQKLSIHSLNPK